MNISQEEIASAIIRFLSEEAQSPLISDESKESLQVAIECIEKVYNIQDMEHSKAADIPNLISRSKAIFNPTLAEKYRSDGNVLMRDKKYMEALEAYDKAVEYDPSNHIHYANRAAAYLKLDRFANAVDDSHTAIILNPSFHKAHARKGLGLMGLNDYVTALVSLEKALELDPDNPIYKEKIDVCKAKINSSSNTNPIDFSGLGSMLSNPAIVNMAQNLMQSPQFRDVISGMAQNVQNSEGGLDLAGMMQGLQESMGQFANDPNFMEQFRDNLDPDGRNQQ